MKERCLNSRHKGWPNYGGRGITICERWFSFSDFLADMGERPHGTTLDRIDSDGNYEPGNVRWAFRHQQRINQRPRRRRAHVLPSDEWVDRLIDLGWAV